MPKIVISGYYGFDNAGDEAVLYAIVQALRNAYNNQVDLVVLSNKPEETIRDFGVAAVNRWDMKAVYKTIKNSDLLVSGGGSLLQDVTSNRSVIYYTTVIAMAKHLKKKIVFYAQGVGPLNSGLSRFLVKRAANKAHAVFVRDEASKSLLKKIGVSKPQIEVVMDPVVGMTLSQTDWDEGKAIFEKHVVSDGLKTVGFYLRNWKVEGDFHDRFASMVNRLIESGYHPVFVPMHYPSDVEAAEKIATTLNGNYTIIKAHYAPQQILALTKQLDFVVAMRLHGMIMAANAQVPFMGISYDPKIEAFAKAVAFGEVFDVNPFDENACFESLINQLSAITSLKQELESKHHALYDLATKPAQTIRTLL